MKNIFTIFGLMLILFTVGCGAQSQEVDNEKNIEQAGISITDFSDRSFSFEEPPKKIVALGNGEVDIIYALGEEVVGRPTGEAILKEAEVALEVGSTHRVDLEKITSLQPDVVLGNHPMNGNDVQSIEGIGSEMILTSANSVEDIKRQITLFGMVLEKEDKAQEIINNIEEKITTIQSELPEKKTRVLLVYGAPGTNMAALPNSLSGNILELAGGENIASDYPSLDMYPQYAQLNTERIIEANPQMIFLMSHGNPEEVRDGFIKEMSKTAGWNELDAVKNERFVILPPNLFGTNPGTKIVDAIDYLHELLQDVKDS